MRFAKTPTARPAWELWHDERQRARREAISEQEFSETDKVAYDLDEDDPVYPLGGLPSEVNESTFIVEDPVSGESYDLRDAHPYI